MFKNSKDQSDLQRKLMSEEKEVTLDDIKAKWFGIFPERQRMLMEILLSTQSPDERTCQQGVLTFDVRAI